MFRRKAKADEQAASTEPEQDTEQPSEESAKDATTTSGDDATIKPERPHGPWDVSELDENKPAHTAPRLDSFNKPFLHLLRHMRGAEPDLVAGRHDVSQIGAERFKQPACGAAIDGSIFRLNQIRQPMHTEDAALQAGVFVDLQIDTQPRLIVRSFRANDRTFSCQ